MELTAVITGLSALKEPCAVTLYSAIPNTSSTPSRRAGPTKWRANGCMRNAKDPALNPDLWEKLLDLLEKHEVTFVWVKGHAGHPENERCDQLGRAGVAKI